MPRLWLILALMICAVYEYACYHYHYGVLPQQTALYKATLLAFPFQTFSSLELPNSTIVPHSLTIHLPTTSSLSY
jgi:hypothetical protein